MNDFVPADIIRSSLLNLSSSFLSSSSPSPSSSSSSSYNNKGLFTMNNNNNSSSATMFINENSLAPHLHSSAMRSYPFNYQQQQQQQQQYHQYKGFSSSSSSPSSSQSSSPIPSSFTMIPEDLSAIGVGGVVVSNASANASSNNDRRLLCGFINRNGKPCQRTAACPFHSHLKRNGNNNDFTNFNILPPLSSSSPPSSTRPPLQLQPQQQQQQQQVVAVNSTTSCPSSPSASSPSPSPLSSSSSSLLSTFPSSHALSPSQSVAQISSIDELNTLDKETTSFHCKRKREAITPSSSPLPSSDMETLPPSSSVNGNNTGVSDDTFSLATAADLATSDSFKRSAKRQRMLSRRRKAIGTRREWTRCEHIVFLLGLNKYGKGSDAWRSIAQDLGSRTVRQIQSHAQKYFLYLQQGSRNADSLFHIRLESDVSNEDIEEATEHIQRAHRQRDENDESLSMEEDGTSSPAPSSDDISSSPSPSLTSSSSSSCPPVFSSSSSSIASRRPGAQDQQMYSIPIFRPQASREYPSATSNTALPIPLHFCPSSVTYTTANTMNTTVSSNRVVFTRFNPNSNTSNSQVAPNTRILEQVCGVKFGERIKFLVKWHGQEKREWIFDTDPALASSAYLLNEFTKTLRVPPTSPSFSSTSHSKSHKTMLIIDEDEDDDDEEEEAPIVDKQQQDITTPINGIQCRKEQEAALSLTALGQSLRSSAPLSTTCGGSSMPLSSIAAPSRTFNNSIGDLLNSDESTYACASTTSPNMAASFVNFAWGRA